MMDLPYQTRMMDLPYQTELVGDHDQFDAIVKWCDLQWPNLQGHAWCVRQTNNFRLVTSVGVGRMKELGWIYTVSFQREEDLLLYQITWK